MSPGVWGNLVPPGRRRGTPCGCPRRGSAGAKGRHKACPYLAVPWRLAGQQNQSRLLNLI